jgi:hypothetical protein
MIQAPLEQEILAYLHKLAPPQQLEVLTFVRALAAAVPTGVPGRDLLPFAGLIGADDLHAMLRAINEDCEQVSPNEW